MQIFLNKIALFGENSFLGIIIVNNKKNSTLRYLLLSFLWFITWAGFAQKPTDYAYLNAKYPDEDGVFLNNSESAEIVFEGDSLKIINGNSSEFYLITEAGGGYAERNLPYSSFISLQSVNAVTLAPNGEKYKEVKVTDISDISRINGGIFYDDTRYKKIMFPSLLKGAIAKLDYTQVYHEPRFLPAFYFNSYAPVLKAQFSITFPDEVKLSYKFLGKNTDKIKFSSVKSKGKTTYTFTATDMEAMEFESNSPPSENIYPHVVFFINEVQHNGKNYTYLKDVQNLYDWYYSLTEHVNKKKDDKFQELVDNITAGKQNDREKVKAIFYWVQDNIKYIAFEAGLEGFVPAEATTVCNNKYGDCKGMASIISTMCKYAGVDAKLVWIGSRDIGYKYSEVPSPLCDNHMIAAYKDNGQWVFLDATCDYLMYGMPTDMIQGKEALISIDKGKYELVEVPVVDKDMSRKYSNIAVSIDNGILNGKANTAFTGYEKINQIYLLRSQPENKWKELMQDVLQTGNNKFEVTDFSITGREAREDSLQITFDFNIPNYAKQVDDECYVNLHLDKMGKDSKIDVDKRKTDIVLDNKYRNIDVVKLSIPSGYSIDYVPENMRFDGKKFGFTIQYTKSANDVSLTREIWMDTLQITTEDFAQYNEMIKKLNSCYSDVVVLKKQ